MPFFSSNSFYAIPASAAVGDRLTAIKCDSKVSLTVTSFRRKGSFSGQGYFEYLLETDDGDTFVGYGESK